MRKDITNVVFDFGGVVAPADLSIVINKFKALGLEDIEKYLNMVRQQGFFGDFETRRSSGSVSARRSEGK